MPLVTIVAPRPGREQGWSSLAPFSHRATRSTGWAVKNTPCPSRGAEFLVSFACSARGCCKQLSALSWLILGPWGGTSASLRANPLPRDGGISSPTRLDHSVNQVLVQLAWPNSWLDASQGAPAARGSRWSCPWDLLLFLAKVPAPFGGQSADGDGPAVMLWDLKSWRQEQGRKDAQPRGYKRFSLISPLGCFDEQLLALI